MAITSGDIAAADDCNLIVICHCRGYVIILEGDFISPSFPPPPTRGQATAGIHPFAILLFARKRKRRFIAEAGGYLAAVGEWSWVFMCASIKPRNSAMDTAFVAISLRITQVAADTVATTVKMMAAVFLSIVFLSTGAMIPQLSRK